MSPSVVIPSIKREGSTFTQSHVDLLRGLSEVRDSMEEDSDQIFSGEPSPNHLLTPDTSRYNYAQKRLRQSPHTPEPIPGIMLDIEEHEDLMHQLSHFRQKWKQAESEIEQLKRESREKEALLAKSHSASFSFEAEIRRKNARIADLESQVSKQACLQPYLDLESGDLSAETIGEIRSKIAILGKRISAIELMSGLEYPALNDIAVEGSSELLEMVNSTLGYDVHGPVHRIKDIMDANISPQQFIQSLIGAAVCEKVFRQKFKCIDMVSTSLLDEYRNHIAAACTSSYELP